MAGSKSLIIIMGVRLGCCAAEPDLSSPPPKRDIMMVPLGRSRESTCSSLEEKPPNRAKAKAKVVDPLAVYDLSSEYEIPGELLVDYERSDPVMSVRV